MATALARPDELEPSGSAPAALTIGDGLIVCPNCEGQGQVIGEPKKCEACGGAGRVAPPLRLADVQLITAVSDAAAAYRDAVRTRSRYVHAWNKPTDALEASTLADEKAAELALFDAIRAVMREDLAGEFSRADWLAERQQLTFAQRDGVTP
jgi:hypothetical protein